MPKVYLSMEERKEAEYQRADSDEDYTLSHTLHNKIRDSRITQAVVAQKAGVGISTVRKAEKDPASLQITTLRKIFRAAGLKLSVTGGK